MRNNKNAFKAVLITTMLAPCGLEESVNFPSVRLKNIVVGKSASEISSPSLLSKLKGKNRVTVGPGAGGVVCN